MSNSHFEARPYVTAHGVVPFEKWFDGLDPVAALKVRSGVARLESGNFGSSESVGGGVSEHKIDFGPGYRIYYTKRGSEILLLLCGGTKKRQQSDVAKAQDYLKDYKTRARSIRKAAKGKPKSKGKRKKPK